MNFLDKKSLLQAMPAAVEVARAAGISSVQVIAERFAQDEALVGAMLASELGQAFEAELLIASYSIIGDTISRETARQHRVVHAKKDGTECLLVDDPLDERVLHWASTRMGQRLPLRVVTPAAMRSLLEQWGTLAAEPSLPRQKGVRSPLRNEANGVSLLRRAQSPVIGFVDSALQSAWSARASDVHFESQRDGIAVKFRIDGLLVDQDKHQQVPPAEEILSRIKVMAELDIAEKRVPQDGRFAVDFDGRMVDCRISVMPSAHGEDAVVRILDKRHLLSKDSSLNLERLGFTVADANRVRSLARQPHGMLLVTGPTGSGKTTTLYAVLSEIRSGTEKIVTIEDPIEYELEGVLQVPVNEKKGLTFARGLRSILRHDPDLIMVGEIRDRETAEIAIQSALTGHLVFTTVHANSALDVVSRFTHMGVDLYALASSLNGVLAQRLVRLACRSCAVVDSHAEHAKEILLRVGLSPAVVLTASGCAQCRFTGFSGRTAVSELLELDDSLRDLLVTRAAIVEVKRYVEQRQGKSLRAAAYALVAEGVTTMEEAQRVVGLA